MAVRWIDVATLACFALSALGCIYALVAAALARRLAARRDPVATSFPGVTIVKPLKGADDALADDLASFCDQRYPGPLQVLFGVNDPRDAAVPLVERLIAQRPGRDLALCITAHAGGANPKIANVVGLQAHIRHDIVLLSDSDIRVAPDYLAGVVATLAEPGVGAVTCLYRGEARAGPWSKLAAMAIDYHFLPSVLVGLALRLARPCFGSTIALRHATLARIGGFEAFIDALADDHAIGEAVRATGARVALPRLVVAHTCTERRFADLWIHELRWARTIRAASPAGYAGLAVTHPLPFAILGAALSGLSPAAMAGIAAAVGSRLVLQWQVDHTLGVPRGRAWLGPARDLLQFAVFLASFFVGVVRWRGQRYKVDGHGTLAPLGDPKA
jgi:ceramide glucosyltransferase